MKMSLLLPRAHLSSIYTIFGRRNYSIVKNWNESQIITDRRSKFQARHVEISDLTEIPEILRQFLADHKSIAKNSSHPHMLAWRTGQLSSADPGQDPVYTNIQQGFKDCGEKGAGSKILDVLISQNAMNKLVIVTRWFGGSHLGSLRFRHIVNCSAESLRKGSHGEQRCLKRKTR
ncbi:ribosomal protein S5 domain 2-like protein [Metschnikowia bicuspidata var. bicuspidata NRRL YB-4993]|uniref:Ribosomal protein S5 domain 2-like protein n=1 Tax=Metschnikowia bicuspidata var. bicuspidata NRRL YB-4993 TaxID=869754 RepID=A0A1A0H7U0_9ASCO|nr:ribosomal protein S5 domain 2-like protein [Metschnikowia bicuspidata var. bicuspidata NRRL YB-4993]OBA20050.1 ribosomal protein S5 domain 2-like protein [Metschnikowia bicuspidata var. bicuspidata NRRL YB-4993]